MLVLLMGCMLQSEAATNEPADRIPAGWEAGQMAHEALGQEWTNATGRILVWMIREDIRPLYVESAVLWLQVNTPAGRKWKLAHVFRHPKSPPSTTWTISQVMDACQFGTSGDYAAPPEPRVVEAFLRETWWRFKPDKTWRLLDGAVCARNWQACTGAPAPEALVGEPERWRSRKQWRQKPNKR